MTARKQVWRGLGTVGPAQAMSQVLGLLRNVIIAAVLTDAADVGVVALLASVLALVELVSDVSTDKVLVQSAKGNEPVLQRTAQSVMVIRGVSQCAVLLAISWPVVWIFDVREAWWAFVCVAAVPLIRGFVNLDPVRRQRELRYGASTLSDLVPSVVATAAAWPLAWWLDSYAAVVCLSIGHALVYVTMTHLMAERRYGLSWDRESVRTLVAFATPLLFNGILIYLTNQGDRAIIGAAYTLELLGVYYVAGLLIGAPVAMLAKTAVAIGLPMLSRVQDSPGAFVRRYSMCIEWLCVMASLLAVVSMLVGDELIMLISKEKYAAAASYTAFIGAMQAAWVIRVGPTLAAMARGDTVNALVTNIVRAMALVGVVGVAVSGAELKWVVLCGIVGEVAATTVSVVRLRRKHGVPIGATWRPAWLVGLTVAGCGAVDLSGALGHGWINNGLALLGGCVCVTGAACLICPTLRDEFVRAVRAGWARRGIMSGVGTR